MKTCSKCKIEKELACFHNRKSSKDGFATICKECKYKIDKTYRINNKEKIKEQRKDYSKFYNRYYYQKNKEREMLRSKRWATENKEKHLKARRNNEKQKRKNEPAYRLKTNISNTINKMLKSLGTTKRGKSFLSKIDWTPQQLKEHLENQFDEKMSWENYGSYWEIDHIYPQSLLSYDSLEHPNFLKCWCLNNLRPLEAVENNKKGNKINE